MLIAFVLQHSAADFRSRVQQAGGEEAVASLGVGSSVDETSELSPAECGGAHGAGLDSHIQAAVAQVLAAQGIGSGGQGYHLGMCRRVCETLHHVVPPSYHASLAYDHGPYRYLVFRERGPGLFECGAHEPLVSAYLRKSTMSFHTFIFSPLPDLPRPLSMS